MSCSEDLLRANAEHAERAIVLGPPGSGGMGMDSLSMLDVDTLADAGKQYMCWG